MNRSKPIGWFWILSLLFITHVATAEVVVLPLPVKPNPMLMGTEQFPESRFGQAPTKPDLGVKRGFAKWAVEEMETPNSAFGPDFSASGETPSDRTPAGLEYSATAPERGGNGIASSTGVLGPAAQAEKEKAKINPLHTKAGAGFSLTPPEVNPTSLASSVLRKGVQEVALIASDLGFFPKTVFVSRDVPVRMFVTGSSKNTLCIMMDSFQVRRQVRTQKIEEITFTPTLPGKYRFYCPVNGMEGSLIVKEFASASTTRKETSREE